VPDKKVDPKPAGGPGRINTDPVKKSPSPSPGKKADPGPLRTVGLREARRPTAKR
jgi:hypothetical protein